MKHSIVGKIVLVGVLASALIVAAPVATFAHVVVKPNSALTGAYETFTTSVPNEKDVAVTGVRLVIPENVESVTPTVKQGWEVQIKKDGDRVSEISWTGGEIAPELRDEFTFSAHLPSKPGDITWKAYQTYQDGSVVAWDQKPSEEEHHSEDRTMGPYSVTTVSEATKEATETPASNSNILLYVLSGAALVLSVFALLRTVKK